MYPFFVRVLYPMSRSRVRSRIDARDQGTSLRMQYPVVRRFIAGYLGDGIGVWYPLLLKIVGQG